MCQNVILGISGDWKNRREGLYREFVVFVEIHEWVVISKSLGLNKKKRRRQQSWGNTPNPAASASSYRDVASCKAAKEMTSHFS